MQEVPGAWDTQGMNAAWWGVVVGGATVVVAAITAWLMLHFRRVDSRIPFPDRARSQPGGPRVAPTVRRRTCHQAELFPLEFDARRRIAEPRRNQQTTRASRSGRAGEADDDG